VAARTRPPALRQARYQSMSDCITVRKTYQYRLYRCDKRDHKLRHKIFVASRVWNHFIALQRRYYRLTGRYISYQRMSTHVLKLRKTQRFARWRDLYSQSCQEVCRRVDDAYQRFFKGLVAGRPTFKKARKYRSFTFPQSGYTVNGNTITIDGVKYRFVKHRAMGGQMKTLTVKRDHVGRLWLFFSVLEDISIGEASTGKSGGFDFGLKAFLTDDEGRAHSSPQAFAAGLRKTRTLNRQLSRKVDGSKRRKRAKQALAKHSIHAANQRREHHFKLAHALCKEYDVLCFEDLNLDGMKRLWGRKVSDLGFASFLRILEWVALKRGKRLVKIDRWYPSTQTCHVCQHQNASITLRDREWVCPECGTQHVRDHNAAINIKTVGTSMGYRSASKTKRRLRRRGDGRSPRL
ncbi:MAG: transposase, partial [Acidobacteriales bacterium]|nr:transposase [Terriglobales bacterium]